MSVHRFLTNTDIVYAVVGHLDLFPRPITEFEHLVNVTNEAIVARRTLASAALTCRAFSEPASKTLWTCLHLGLLPLLKTFSCLKRKKLYSEFGNKFHYVLDGDISAAEWDNYDRLASWVRYIDCPCVAVEPSVTDALIKHCQTKGEALLPNLRALRWSESAGDTHKLQLLRALCLAPSLSLVSISAYNFVAQDIATITGTRPDLAHFSSTACIYRLPPDSPIFAMCSLKSLRVAEMDESSFHQIGTLPYLTDLSTEVRDADSLHMNAARTPSQGDPAFPTLQRLRTLGTPATLIWVITQISSPILTSLSAGSPTEHLADILPMIETLFALPAVQSLQQLHLNVIVTDRSGEGAVEIAFADIAHSILPLRHLEDVRLSIRPRTRTLSISDADIALIKSAWSRLRKLSLCFNASDLFQDVREPILRPSLLALVDLALARPQLETLDVEVASVTEDDLVQLESISTRALGPFEHPTAFKLTWLTFARGEHRKRITFPADIPRLARALHRLFPLVGGSRGSVNYYMWHKVDMEDDVRWLLYQLEELKSQESDHVVHTPVS